MKRVLLLFLLITLVTLAGNNPVKQIKAYRIDGEFRLDGTLNESLYNHPPATGFIQKDPFEGKAASQETKVWIGYDDNFLYVGALLNDTNPELIDRSLARKDDDFASDWFLFYIDSYHDKKTGYYFAINPAGSKQDGILYNDSWSSSSWDGVWESKSCIDNKGWRVEVRLPLSQLRFEEHEELTFGINFKRKIKRNEESSYLVMIPKTESGYVSHFADLTGLTNIKPSERFEVTPYVVQKAQYIKHDENDPFYKGNQYGTSVGADLKIGLGSNFTLDATINPDFGQVEVDPAVLNLSAFETFYSEKRPFFVEGSNFFQFGSGGANNNWGFNFGWPNLFYTRRIGRSPQLSPDTDGYTDEPGETRILGAAKITGKIDPTWSLGALSSITERTFANVIDEDGKRYNFEVEPFTHYGVLRTKKEFNNGKQALGMIFTTVNRDLKSDEARNNLAENAYTLGVDGWTYLDSDEEYILTGALIGSQVSGTKEFMTNLQERSYHYLQRPDRENSKLDSSLTSMTGMYGRVALNKQKGNFYLNTALGVVTPRYEQHDLGFQYWSDKINMHQVVGYRWYKTDGIFRQKNAYLMHFRDYTTDGKIINNGLMTFVYFQLENYFAFEIDASYNFEDYNTNFTRGGPLVKNPGEYWYQLWFGTDSREDIRLTGGFEVWGDDLGSTGYSIFTTLKMRPSPQLNISINPTYTNNFEMVQWVDSYDDITATDTYGGRYLFGEMDRQTLSTVIRTNWTFTPDLSLQLYLQPFITVGKYNNYKYLTKASSMEFTNFGTNGSTISYSAENDEYTVDADGAGSSESYTFENSDFNYKSFKANVVLRWEFLSGSVLYLVWTHNKTNTEDPGKFKFKRDFDNLFNAEPDNLFLMKFTYWLDV